MGDLLGDEVGLDVAVAVVVVAAVVVDDDADDMLIILYLAERTYTVHTVIVLSLPLKVVNENAKFL